MSKLIAVGRFFLWVIGIFVLAMLSLYLLVFLIPPYSGYDLLLGHLLFGFVAFLKNNIPAISWNAATWGPGLGAFVMAVVVAHRFLSHWAERTGRQWSFATSFCLLMLVPVLFVVSLIVPGVLLQWEVLREVVWIDLG